MRAYIIDYAIIDPITLANKIESQPLGVTCRVNDIDEDYFELIVIEETPNVNWAKIEEVLAEYV